MEYKQWINAIRPKVLGTRNLHTQFGSTLDFFVMLSSVIGVLGNTSQANYAAGGTFHPVIFNWMVHVYPFEKDQANIWSVERQHGDAD